MGEDLDTSKIPTANKLAELFADGAAGRADVDMQEILWCILADTRDSFRLALKAAGVSADIIESVNATVVDYLVNHYGD